MAVKTKRECFVKPICISDQNDGSYSVVRLKCVCVCFAIWKSYWVALSLGNHSHPCSGTVTVTLNLLDPKTQPYWGASWSSCMSNLLSLASVVFLLIMWKDRVDGYSVCFISFYCATHMWIVRHCCHNVSGCLSHASIVSKWIKISSDFFLGLVALPLLFSNTIWWLQNSNGKGSLSLGWIR